MASSRCFTAYYFSISGQWVEGSGAWMRCGTGLIRLVLSPSPHKNMKTLDEFSPAPPGRTDGQPSVLVVDDETAVRRFAARVLQRDGYQVVEATDGVEALETVRVGGVSFEVVVSDIVMPRLNGVELMQALSESHPT